MKIIDNINTIFNDGMLDLLKKFLEERVRRGNVSWEDAYNTLLSKTSDVLSNGLTLTRQQTNGKIKAKDILTELSLVKIFLAALELESKNIDRVLGTHELIRKDNVRTITDVKRRYLDIVNHSIQELKTRNIEIKDGRIRLFPLVVQNFKIRDVEVEYLPDSIVKRIGNDPSPENITPGTDRGYWETTILTKGLTPVTAKVVLNFGDTISFNRLRMNLAGKYASTITDVEIVSGGNWTSIHTGDITSKFVTVIYPQIYQTTQIRITFTQTIGEFLWWTVTDNGMELLKEETREDAVDLGVRRSTEKDAYLPITEEKFSNVYGFVLGIFNVVVSLNIYSGDEDGTFYSRKFISDVPIETVKLVDDIIEYKPGSSSILYNIIQQDGSRVATIPGQKVSLTKAFTTTQTLTNGKANFVELASPPLDTNISTTVNGDDAQLVTEFSGNGSLEYIINGKKLFFSVPVEGKTVSVVYNHRTDFFVIEIILNNGTPENQLDSPYVENFGVVINGID